MSRQKKGIVVAKSGAQTIKVAVERVTLDPLYGKRRKKTKHYLVHDPKGETKMGESVVIVETRPLSRTKHFILKSSHAPAKKHS